MSFSRVVIMFSEDMTLSDGADYIWLVDPPGTLFIRHNLGAVHSFDDPEGAELKAVNAGVERF